MHFKFDILAQSRKNLLGLLAPLNIDQLNQIPSGFKNNLIWNLGHVIVSHQVLCYKFSGLPFTIPEEYVERFKRGTVPDNPVDQQEVDLLKQLAISTVSRFREDYEMGTFKTYQSYQSLYGVKLQSIEDALVFNITHEGLHLGYIMAMKKLIV